MFTIYSLYMTIFTAKNVLDAYKLARKSRKDKQEVYMFDQQLEIRILQIIRDLQNRTYKHDEYKKIILHDSKKRYIYSPHFRDHILHHLIYKQIYDLIDRKMVYSTFACRKWYGSHKSITFLKKNILKEEKKISSFWKKEKLYYLKLDFSKFFFSINHDILKRKLRKIIFNEELLYCIFLIIDSYTSSQIYDELLKDNNFYINTKEKWLPIWWILSQIFANFYLNDLDQFLKHKLKVKFVRYMDDIVILGDLKTLNFTKKEIFDFVKTEKLILNPKKINLNLISDGIKFVWYRIKWWKIFVWKSTKNKLNKFLDILWNLDLEILEENDIKKINNSMQRRLWVFSHSSFWLNYFKKRENTDFLRGGNGNNEANAGVFTLNLNRSATNQNNNVGFRCSQ